MPPLGGIPHGNILSLLLFIIFINDLAKSCGSDLFMLVDDCKLYKYIVDAMDNHTLPGLRRIRPLLSPAGPESESRPSPAGPESESKSLAL